MKVLLINGSPHQKGCTYTALSEVEKILQQEGIETEIFWIGNKPMQGCIACGYCKTHGVCVFKDQVNQIIEILDDIDGFVLGSPVYYANPAGPMMSFLQRLFYASGARMNGKVGASVVSCRRGGAASTFEDLNMYFTIAEMPVVSSQYWNQVHGNTPEQVLQDEEGLQTMRTLGYNMAWLLKSIQLAKEQGIKWERKEDKIFTNFIR